LFTSGQVIAIESALSGGSLQSTALRSRSGARYTYQVIAK